MVPLTSGWMMVAVVAGFGFDWVFAVDRLVATASFPFMHDENRHKHELDLGLEENPGPSRTNGMIFSGKAGSVLSPAQIEFNKLMKRLETTRAKHERQEIDLNNKLATCIRDLMPLVDELHRINFLLVLHGHDALYSFKLTARRREWFSDLLSERAGDLLADSSGLTHEDVASLEKIVAYLGPSHSHEQEKESAVKDFDMFRDMLESAARMAGVDINLRDLDIEKDPAEFERMLRERMDATAAAFEERAATAKGRARKPTKAQLEKERKQREIQEAKQRDLKSLYKQLAKALHPDLEPDPVLKAHKESWMKRLTSAYAANDLRELLKIEMEWLGEEASNLATAGDDKLRIYCMVLKEQITEVRRNSDNLRHQPQYSPLWRFMDNFTGYIPDMRTVHVRLHDEILHQKNALEILKRGDKETRKMINEWADSHAQTFQPWDYPF